MSFLTYLYLSPTGSNWEEGREGVEQEGNG